MCCMWECTYMCLVPAHFSGSQYASLPNIDGSNELLSKFYPVFLCVGPLFSKELAFYRQSYCPLGIVFIATLNTHYTMSQHAA